MSTPNPFNFPINITDAGLQPQTPESLNEQLIAAVTATNPGYTILPAGLVEDVASTEVAGISLSDQAKVDLVNSLTPNGANLFILYQLAQIYLGQPAPGLPTNTSVEVVFTAAENIGFVVPNGWLVGDGTNTYQVQGGGVIQSGGSTEPLTAICTSSSAAFSVPANTVTTINSSVPATVSITVNNPEAGTPASAAETPYAFRTRVLQAGLAACVGTSRFIKTMLGAVLGAQANLISVQIHSGIEVIVGGDADQYAIAYAIFCSTPDPSVLVGSQINSDRNVTVAIYDYPDTYNILYVAAPVQTITMTITWNTTATNFTGGSAFPALVQPPLVAYINSLAPGQPINVLEMNEIFQQAVEDVLDVSLLTRLVFAVSINGTPTNPGSGTYIVSGDPESSCFTALSGAGITVTQ